MTTDHGRVGEPTGLSQAEPVSRLGPSGFDPSRKTFAFIKDNDPDYPGEIGVAVVQKEHEDATEAELIDFRACSSWHEADAFLALYGMDRQWPVWTAPAIATEARRAETENTGSVHEGAGPKDIAQPQSEQSQ